MKNTYVEKANSLARDRLCSSEIGLPVNQERRFVKKLVNRLII
jgi:hypothetical protein